MVASVSAASSRSSWAPLRLSLCRGFCTTWAGNSPAPERGSTTQADGLRLRRWRTRRSHPSPRPTSPRAPTQRPEHLLCEPFSTGEKGDGCRDLRPGKSCWSAWLSGSAITGPTSTTIACRAAIAVGATGSSAPWSPSTLILDGRRRRGTSAERTHISRPAAASAETPYLSTLYWFLSHRYPWHRTPLRTHEHRAATAPGRAYPK